MGGGGQQQTGAQTQYNAISAFAAPYVNQMLGQGQALTSQPYQAYTGQQNANFTGLQNQSFTGAGNLGVSNQTGQATNAANTATNNLLNTSYNPTQATSQQFTDPGVASSYMNPYLQQSLAPQLQMLQQQQGLQNQQLQSQATQQGAFGNSRFGLAQGAQNQANQLATSNLLGQGYNNAYTNAQQQFNADQARNLQTQGMNIGQQQFGANLGLQGNQAALTGANTLGNLGQQQFGQQTGALNLQNAYGTQQQQNQQNILNTQQQNFNNQLNYPYQQLSYMQGLLSGLPVSSSTTQMYQSPGSQVAQAAGLGLGVLAKSANGGLQTAFKRGGEIQGYAEGATVSSDPMSSNFIRQALASMGPEELRKEREALKSRTDPQGMEELAIVDQLLGIQDQSANPAQGRPMDQATQIPQAAPDMVPQAAIPAGSIANGITPQMADNMVQTAATGGIMGFADQGEVQYKPVPEKEESTIGHFLSSLGFGNEASKAAETRGQVGMKSMAVQQMPGLFEKLTATERANREAVAKNIAEQSNVRQWKSGAVTDPAEKAKLEAQLAAFKQDTTPTNAAPSTTIANPFTPSGNPMDVSMSSVPGPVPIGNKKPEDHQMLTQAVNHVAGSTGQKPEDLGTLASVYYDMFHKNSEPTVKAMRDLLESQKPKDTAEKDERDALSRFGFGWAAAATKPGSTFLGSAAQAAPGYMDALQKSREAQQLKQDNYAKLALTQKQYELSLDKGDMQSAVALAGQQRMLQMQQKQLDATINHYGQIAGFQKQQLEMEQAKLDQAPAEIRTLEALKNNPELVKQIPAASQLKGGYNLDARIAATNSLNLQKELAKARENFVKKVSGLKQDSPMYKSAFSEYQRQAQDAMANSQLGSVPGGISSALPQPGLDLSQWGQPKVAGAK